MQRNPGEFISIIEDATRSKFRTGNKVELLQNGEEIFPAMLAEIKKAEKSIEFATYVYWRSDVASQFAKALAERARSGVKVKLLIDAVGGAIMDSRTIWNLERAGVKVAWFRPARTPYLRKLNNRTHRKILIIDGYVGFTGGVGIADQWTGRAQDPMHWRETHCRVEGPACSELLAGFAENWIEATGERISRPIPHQTEGGVAVQTTISTADGRPTSMELLFRAAIAMAKNRLWISTAYFVPAADYIEALANAAARGVDVQVITNGPFTNHKVTRAAGRGLYGQMLRAGVKIYEYQGTVMHCKIMTVDGGWATLGSTNLDDRSLVLNDELNVSFVDTDLVASLDSKFLEDIDRSNEIDPQLWGERPWTDRVAEGMSSVLRRQL